eukprot:scaffold43089_cov50-Attheya_sp.AAC.4
MVCVDPAMQQGGIGKALVEAAHVVARDRWNKTSITAAMESTNIAALQLFHKCGYRPWLDYSSNQTTQRVVMVPVGYDPPQHPGMIRRSKDPTNSL